MRINSDKLPSTFEAISVNSNALRDARPPKMPPAAIRIGCCLSACATPFEPELSHILGHETSSKLFDGNRDANPLVLTDRIVSVRK